MLSVTYYALLALFFLTRKITSSSRSSSATHFFIIVLYFQQKYWRTCVSSLASDVFRSARSSKLNFFVIKSVDKDESNMQFINALIAKKKSSDSVLGKV